LLTILLNSVIVNFLSNVIVSGKKYATDKTLFWIVARSGYNVTNCELPSVLEYFNNSVGYFCNPVLIVFDFLNNELKGDNLKLNAVLGEYIPVGACVKSSVQCLTT